MEYLSLLLALALLSGFFYVCTAGRVRIAREAGPLVLRVLRPVRFRWLLVVAGLGGLCSVACGVDLILTLDEGAGVTALAKSALWAVYMPLLTVTWLRQLGCALEVRRLGIVPRAGRSKRFVSWDHVKYCKWIQPPGTLLVQCKLSNTSYRIRPEQMDAVSEALCRYVEVRQSSGLPLVPRGEALPGSPEVEPAGQRADIPDSRPRRFQFGLSTLLLAVLVASAVFSWIGIRVRRTRAQKEVVAKLHAFRPNATFRGGRVVQLGFAPSGSGPGDAELELLKELVRLEKLDLAGTNLSDAGLVHLQGLTWLEQLDLSGTKISDAGLQCLHEMDKLELLYLSGTAITGSGLAHLEELPELGRLYLSNTQITDATLRQLGQLPALQWLDLSGTQISDAGLVHLGEMTGLFLVDLTGTRVTDAGLRELQRALPDLNIRTGSGLLVGPGAVSPSGRSVDRSRGKRPLSPPP